MKNKALKNLIILSVFAISIFGVSKASASIYYESGIPYDSNYYNVSYDGGSYSDPYGGYSTGYAVRDNYALRQQIELDQYAFKQQQLQAQAQLSEQQYYYDQQKLIQEQSLAIQKQNLANAKNNSTVSTNYVYNQPKTQYTATTPTTTQVQYVASPTTISYIPATSQGASVASSTSKKVVYATNTGTQSNTGQYVSYDANNLGANVYGYNNGQVVVDPSYDPNGVTALSMNGSGAFLPTSVFQWFMFILLVLAIIIVARIIIKKNAANNAHGAPAH